MNLEQGFNMKGILDIVHPSWIPLLSSLLENDRVKNLIKEIERDISRGIEIYPKPKDIFRALSLGINDVSVVILSQDPYHTPNTANGLAFSSNSKRLPPSLINIYKELEIEGFNKKDRTGDLSSWVNQGVLLLNTVLTVERGKANSHKGKGWEIVTNGIIKELSKSDRKIVFLLWGNQAKAKSNLISGNKYKIIITSTHPSPLSADKGWWNNGCFIKANEYLDTPIDW